MKKLNVAVVGLSFGLEFVPIYLEHPDVEKVYLVDTDASLLHVAQNRYGIPEENCTCEIQEVLDDPDIGRGAPCHATSNACTALNSSAESREALRMYDPNGVIFG